MAICKFFLQGECRFGENCRFEHQLNSERIGNQRFVNNEPQAKILNPKTGTEVELSALLNSVKNDVVSGDRGKQWLLTCYAPYKEKPLYPGFVDMSFEEVRWGFIEAKKSNILQQYIEALQKLQNEAKMRYNTLENPTKEIVALLKNIYNNGNPENFVANDHESSRGTFASNGSSIFGQQNSAQNGGSIFGQPNSSQNNFGQSNVSVFGQSNASLNTGSVFGQQLNTFQQANSQNSGNLFAQQSSTNSILGGKAGSLFGNAGNQQTGSGIFGNQKITQFTQPQASTNIFGQASSGSMNIFGQNNSNNNQQNTRLFTNNQANTSGIFGNQNIFGQQNNIQNSGSSIVQHNPTISNSSSVFGAHSSNIFNPQNNIGNIQGNVQSTGNIFGQSNTVQNSGNIFGASSSQSTPNKNLFTPAPSGIFGNGQQQTATQQVQSTSITSDNIFSKVSQEGNQLNQNSLFQTSNQSQQMSSVFGLNPVNITPNNSGSQKDYKKFGAYSNIADLTEEYSKWFEGDIFDIGNIPDKPPTYEMCF